MLSGHSVWLDTIILYLALLLATIPSIFCDYKLGTDLVIFALFRSAYG